MSLASSSASAAGLVADKNYDYDLLIDHLVYLSAGSEELLLVKYFITLESIKSLVDSGQISYKFDSMTQYIMSYDITVSKDGKKSIIRVKGSAQSS